jgi:hypothetical protein
MFRLHKIIFVKIFVVISEKVCYVTEKKIAVKLRRDPRGTLLDLECTQYALDAVKQNFFHL